MGVQPELLGQDLVIGGYAVLQAARFKKGQIDVRMSGRRISAKTFQRWSRLESWKAAARGDRPGIGRRPSGIGHSSVRCRCSASAGSTVRAPASTGGGVRSPPRRTTDPAYSAHVQRRAGARPPPGNVAGRPHRRARARQRAGPKGGGRPAQIPPSDASAGARGSGAAATARTWARGSLAVHSQPGRPGRGLRCVDCAGQGPPYAVERIRLHLRPIRAEPRSCRHGLDEDQIGRTVRL